MKIGERLMVMLLCGCASGADTVDTEASGVGAGGAAESGGGGAGGSSTVMSVTAQSSASSTSTSTSTGAGSGAGGWSKRFGAVGSEGGTRVSTDPDGNLVVLAWLGDDGVAPASLDFGDGALVNAGSTDVVVGKLGPDGAAIWSKRFGDADYQMGWDLAVDAAGNVIVAGELRGTVDFGDGPLTSAGLSDVFVVKLGPDGAVVWAKQFGDAAQQAATSVCVGDDGHIVLSGAFYGVLDFGSASIEAEAFGSLYVASLDADGAPIFARRFEPGSSTDATVAIACGPAGRVAWTGHYHGILELGDGFSLVSPGFPFDSLHQAFVVSLDGAGEPEWARTFGEEESVFQSGLDIAFDAVGNVLASGIFVGTTDFGLGDLASAGGLDTFVIKLDPLGGTLYATRVGGPTDDVGVSLALGESGEVYVTGYIETTVDGAGPLAGGMHLAVIDPSGSLVSNLTFGPIAPGMRRGQDIAALGRGRVMVIGLFEGELELGGNALHSSGGYDMFLAELAPLP